MIALIVTIPIFVVVMTYVVLLVSAMFGWYSGH
jgi:hypothetical protein